MNQTPEAERERALFESQFEGKLDFHRLSPDCDYLYSETGYAWDGWQAARAIPQAAAEPVYQFRQKYGQNKEWIECDARCEERMKSGPAAECFEYRTLYATPRIAAPDRAPSIEAPNFCDRCGKRLHAGGIHTCTPPSTPSIDSATERDAALEDAATVAENFGCNRPIVHPNPSQIVRGRWEGEQAASQNIASIIRGMKKSRAIAAMKGEG